MNFVKEVIYMKKIKQSLLFSFILLSAAASQLQSVKADTVSAGSGNRIHFINTKGASGSDAILLESKNKSLNADKIFEEVEKRSKKYLEEPLTKSYYAYTKYDFMFFEALVNKNTEKMKRAIHKLLEPKIAKKILFDTDINYSFYLNIYVLMYSKIALSHGFDLGINNKTAPKNLIDNTSLQSYEEPYDFMKKIDLVTLTPEKWKEWTEDYSIIVPIT